MIMAASGTCNGTTTWTCSGIAIEIGQNVITVPLYLECVPIHRHGTLIGRALEPLKNGEGEIVVLLSLQ